MKIALVSPYDWAYPGGVTNHIARLSEELTRMGHKVSIMAPSSKPRQELSTPNLTVVGRSIPFPIAGSIARVTISLHRGLQVKSLLEAEKFDIVHLHEPLVSALPWTVLQYSKSLNVGTFHAYVRRSRGYWSLRPLLRRWFHRLHGKIAVSQPAADLIGRYFPGPCKIIPNGIDLAHFSTDAAPIERYTDGKVNLLFVGRMEKRKGLPYLLAAYARLKWQLPELRLIIVGPGKLDNTSERLLAERGLHDVEFVGPVGYEDLPRYYQTAHIFCSPATGSESFGIAILEAMAAGKPVVATTVGGIPEFVAPGQSGLLVPPGDAKALARAIKQLLDDPEKARWMGSQGRKHVREHYSIESVIKQHEDLYELCLAQS